MTTIRTPGARQRLTALLLMMAAATIPSRSRTNRSKRQNENRERGCDVDRARTRVRYRRHYTYSTIKAPDKGEVGGSSPPRPTIEVLICRLLAALVLSLPFRALPLRIETLFVAALL